MSADIRMARTLTEILAPLAQPRLVHVILSQSLSSLSVEVPNLRAHFVLNRAASTVRPRDFVGISVDPEQLLGTLVGLRNKLVLN